MTDPSNHLAPFFLVEATEHAEMAFGGTNRAENAFAGDLYLAGRALAAKIAPDNWALVTPTWGLVLPQTPMRREEPSGWSQPDGRRVSKRFADDAAWADALVDSIPVSTSVAELEADFVQPVILWAPTMPDVLRDALHGTISRCEWVELLPLFDLSFTYQEYISTALWFLGSSSTLLEAREEVLQSSREEGAIS